MPMSGLIVDWGGVLTVGMREAVGSWAAAEDIDITAFVDVMRDWGGLGMAMEAAYNPIHALERGELELPDFEQHLAQALSAKSGVDVDGDGLLDRMFRYFRRSPDMNALVRRAKDQGIRTALLSNSWGNNYPQDLFDGMFDAVVISGEVGMRKPDPAIYEYTVEKLALPPQQCVFVDDLLPNVHAARALGMVGVHHTDYPTTAQELDAIFDVRLSV